MERERERVREGEGGGEREREVGHKGGERECVCERDYD